MTLVTKLDAYFKSLIAPYSYHAKETNEYISISDSVLLSWIFAIINGIFRIILINLVLISLSSYVLGQDLDIQLFHKDGNFGYYFLILSSILDIIFFPLFALFIVQFWSFIIRIFARFLRVDGDIDLKVERVVTGSLSSNVFMAVPILGTFIQKISSLILLFIGMRSQLKFSSALSICVLISPIIIGMLIAIVAMTFLILKNL